MEILKCITCKHFIDEEGPILRCKVFPVEIPHEKMLEPDEKECNKGIRYEEEYDV